jgi:hypothetical protein
MKQNLLRPLTLLTLTGIALSLTSWAQENSQATKTDGNKLKTLREIVRERDVETDVSELEESAEYEDLHVLAKHAEAIVVVRISDEESAFNGDNNIFTSYHVEVLSVLKQTKLNAPLSIGEEPPAPLVTPLKLVRPGGVVMVDRHRAFAKLKGSELLKPDRYFLLFLWWSPAYKAYTLAGGVSGAFLIDMEQRLRPLGSKPGMRKYDGSGLQDLIDEVWPPN